MLIKEQKTRLADEVIMHLSWKYTRVYMIKIHLFIIMYCRNYS